MFGIESYKNINNQSNLEEEEYRQKYLKYKQKYLELKQSGGGLNGEYIYLTTEEKAKELVALFKKCIKNEGSDVQFNIDITGELTGTMNVTNNIDNAEFGKLVQTKTNEFNTFINTEQVKLAKTIENNRSQYTKLFNEHLIKCNNPTQLEIDTLLNDAAYRIQKGTKNIELVIVVSVGEKVGNIGSKIAKGFTGLIKGNAEPAPAVTKSKKNSAKTQLNNVTFDKEEPTVLKKLLNSIKTANQAAHETTATPLTHYVLIKHVSTMAKNEITLVDIENPIKVLPTA